MSPLLREGDFVVTRRRRPSVNDVVVFEHPGKSGFFLIKRVVALAGQRVEIAGGSVSVDGRNEDPRFQVEDTRPDGTWLVPNNHVFVLGDARHRSADDSRALGPVHIGTTANVAVFRYWPAGRFGSIRP